MLGLSTLAVRLRNPVGLHRHSTVLILFHLTGHSPLSFIGYSYVIYKVTNLLPKVEESRLSSAFLPDLSTRDRMKKDRTIMMPMKPTEPSEQPSTNGHE